MSRHFVGEEHIQEFKKKTEDIAESLHLHLDVDQPLGMIEKMKTKLNNYTM